MKFSSQIEFVLHLLIETYRHFILAILCRLMASTREFVFLTMRIRLSLPMSSQKHFPFTTVGNGPVDILLRFKL